MLRPLILVTNDDGIDAKGLWAAVEAVLPLGEVLVVAPSRQWSGAGRAYTRGDTGRIVSLEREINARQIRAYAIDASPALAVFRAVLELTQRRPALVVSGINFGYNLGTDVTISGTVGAALEAAAFSIPAMAVSLEMAPIHHLTGDDAADYAGAISIARQFAQRLLANGLPSGVEILSVNLPRSATPQTPWRLTRLFRGRYFLPREDSTASDGPSYVPMEDLSRVDPDSDVWAARVDGMVSVTPLTQDLTSRVDFRSVNASLHAEPADSL
jgi:5'-nucleotidase